MHCHSGKDRTGLASALTLTLAGVASADVAEDYAETAARLSIDAHLAALPGEAERARSRRLFARSAPARCSPPSSTWTTGTAAPPCTCGRAACPPADLALLRTLTTDP
ncbi:tyrosine-protein phosphatase [Nonomuraea sp. NPDC049421]|uniref:tyrosine-protein phosphatase n=1 Tax=Nonomuraea sp. NPDC049421 TaxID=3155275 RepID=UPI003447D376